MKRRIVKQIASMGLCLAMVFTSVPEMAMTAYAEEVTTCAPHKTESYTVEGGKCGTCQAQAPVSVTTTANEVTYYPTFAEAITAAQASEGCTVTLLDDITLTETQNITSGTFTLDLGSFTLRRNTVGYIMYISSGQITITGKEEGLINSNSGICIDGGTVNIEGGHIKGPENSNEAILIQSGSLKVSGGEISGYTGIEVFANGYGDSTTVEISGTAVIKGSYYGISNSNGNVKISGGEISGSVIPINYSMSDASRSSLNVSDGIIIVGTANDGRNKSTFCDNNYGGSSVNPVLNGGVFPNGIILSRFCCDLSEMLGEKAICLDKDGNVVTLTEGQKDYSTVYEIVQDTQAPVMQYQIGNGDSITFDTAQSNKDFAKKGDTLTLSASDALSGVDTIKYYFSNTEIMEASEFDAIEWQDYTGPLELSADGLSYVYVQATDKCSNTTEIYCLCLQLYTDSTADTTEVTYSYKENSDKKVIVTLNGNTIKGVSLNGTALVLEDDYNVVDGKEISLSKDFLDELDAGEYTFTVSYNPLGIVMDQVELNTTFKVIVKPVSLTISNAQTTGRTYETGNKTVVLDGITLSGIKESDAVSVDMEKAVAVLSSENAGTYDKVTLSNLVLTGDDAKNYTITSTIEVATDVTISKAVPVIGTVSADTLVDSTDISKVVLHRGDTTVAGTLTVDAGQTLQVGENTISYTFTPDDTINYQTVTGNVTVVVQESSQATGSGSGVSEPDEEDGSDENIGDSSNENIGDGSNENIDDSNENTSSEGTWVNDNGTWYYVDESGEKETGWVKDDDIWYYMDESGAMQTGWENVNNTWYYMDESGAMQTGWENVNNTWYYMDESGAMQTGWENVNNTWYYMDESGAMQTGWENVDNTWYYMDESGAMQTDWEYVNNTWYYMDESGAMETGWILDRGTWYYMSGSGEMLTGWQFINGNWYHMNEAGAMETGWILDRGTWYYLYESGAMLTGWQFINGNWYHMDDSGAMQTGRITVNGKRYLLDEDGAWIG